MPDPLEALWEPDRPLEPDPLFAAHLRARIARALALPKGVTVSNLSLDPEPATLPALSGAQPVIPYLIVVDARRALDWYRDVMGADRKGEPLVMPDGRIGHAELEMSGGMIYLADESPESDVAAPRPGQGAAVSLTMSVPDVDRLAERAVRAGAVLERPPADHPYGRNAVIRDPFGHRWIISALAPRPARSRPPGQSRTSGSAGAPASAPAQADHAPRPAAASAEGAHQGDDGGFDQERTVGVGDIGYVSLWVPDVERAVDFFGDVLGWTYRPGSAGWARQVEGQSLAHGLFGGQERSTLFLCFYTDDVDATMERVRQAGGMTGEPRDEPHGRTVGCVDNQGVYFALVELPGHGGRLARDLRNGERNGDVSYVTMEVVDSEKARSFYGSVLNWQFSRGRVEDGWGVDDIVPMTGMQGGHARATTVPMYRVDDIYATVARLRARGGTSSDPEQQSYGLSAECVDDQGTRFYLGQH